VVRAVRAGCDQLLICSRTDWIEAAHRALVSAVKKGALSEDRLVEAAGRGPERPVLAQLNPQGSGNSVWLIFGIIDLACTIMKVERAEL